MGVRTCPPGRSEEIFSVFVFAHWHIRETGSSERTNISLFYCEGRKQGRGKNKTGRPSLISLRFFCLVLCHKEGSNEKNFEGQTDIKSTLFATPKPPRASLAVECTLSDSKLFEACLYRPTDVVAVVIAKHAIAKKGGREDANKDFCSR